MVIVFVISLISSFLGTVWSKSLNRDDFKVFVASEICLNLLEILTYLSAIEIVMEHTPTLVVIPGYVVFGTTGAVLGYVKTMRRRA